MKNLNDYQTQIGLLGKSLLYDFCEIFSPEYLSVVETKIRKKENESTKRFKKLRSLYSYEKKSILTDELPTPWLLTKWENEVKEYYESLGFTGLFLENLVNTFKYYKQVVARYLTPASTLLSLETGENISQEIFKTSSLQIFDHYDSHQSLLKIYSEGFVGSHLAADIKFVENFDFSEVHRVLDLGGGFGHLGELLGASGINTAYDVFDLPGVFSTYENRIRANRERLGQYHFIAGDFFSTQSTIPELGAVEYQLIVLGWILHDWSDEKCIEILRKSTQNLTHGGQIVVLEALSGGNELKFTFLDWVIYVMANGFERSLDDYERLADCAGLKVEKVREHFNRSEICLIKK